MQAETEAGLLVGAEEGATSREGGEVKNGKNSATLRGNTSTYQGAWDRSGKRAGKLDAQKGTPRLPWASTCSAP